MSKKISFGFPKMHLETGERRDFLPELMGILSGLGADIYLEQGYGYEMGFLENDYLSTAPNINFVSNEETYLQDFVIVLRYPGDEKVEKMRSSTCLISMLHYLTRPHRTIYLKKRGIEAISLDSLKDDVGRRIVENLRAMGWNGIEVAFQLLQSIYPSPGLEDPNRLPIKVTVMGAGAVGMYAIQAAIRYGNEDKWRQMANIGATGVQVTAVDYDLTNHPSIMQQIIKYTDVLVDATQRKDTSKPVIPNEWIGIMRPHAVIVDLSVDPYDFSSDPICIKGIEGIPQGNLDQYVFLPGDPIYDSMPKNVNRKNQRHVVSCYSWPGIHPKECMTIYGRQLSPVLRTIVESDGLSNIHPDGAFFHRVINRALLSKWES